MEDSKKQPGKIEERETKSEVLDELEEKFIGDKVAGQRKEGIEMPLSSLEQIKDVQPISPNSSNNQRKSTQTEVLAHSNSRTASISSEEVVSGISIASNRTNPNPNTAETPGNTSVQSRKNEDRMSTQEIDEVLINDKLELDIDRAALESQREIKSIKIDEQYKVCRVVPASSDGNCGFTALRLYLELIGETKLAQRMNRTDFIILVKTLYEDDSSDIITKYLIKEIFKVAHASNLCSWEKEFKNSSHWLEDIHFSLLSRNYNLQFYFYCLSTENTQNYFVPELSYEQVYMGTDVSKINVHIAHLSTRERNHKDSRLNHYEPIIIEPSEEQILKIDEIIKTHKNCKENKVPLHKQMTNKFPINLEDKNKDYSIVSMPGYLTEIELINRYTHKSLPQNFTWTEIPMLAVITGKNGIGKTALLEAILQGFERKISNQKQFQINLKFNEGLAEDDLPDIFEFSTASTSGRIRNTSEASIKRYKEDVSQTFQDLKKYDLAKRYKKPYTLKYPDRIEKYDNIIQLAERESQLQIDSLNDEYYRHFYQKLEILWQESVGIHISTYGSLENYSKYLIERGISLQNINDFLKQKKFKYILSPKSYTLNHLTNMVFDRLVLQENNVSPDIDGGWLSPGERLELLTLLWLYEARVINRTNVGAIFVLDEFDAHLHPELAKNVIETIKTKLVKDYGVQVIMTTHNPTTVSLAPEECIFIMSDENEKKEIKVEKALNKRQAIQLLTSDFVYVNEPFNIVFVEGDNDVKFYQIVQKHLLDSRLIKLDNKQILFKSHGRKKNENSEDSSKSGVKNLVEKLVHAGHEDQSLKDFIFGLVDGDNDKDSSIENVSYLYRYSIENYIFDPIHVFFKLKEALSTDKNFIEINDKIAQIYPDRVNSLKEVIAQPKDDAQKILQFIVDEITNKLIERYNSRISVELEKRQIDTKYKIAKDVNDLFVNNRFKNLITNNKIDTTKEEVIFTNGIRLAYPKFILFIKGHYLEENYKVLFRLGYRSNIKSIGRNQDESAISLMLGYCRNMMLIPSDLKETMLYLQNKASNKKNKQLSANSIAAALRKCESDLKTAQDYAGERKQRIVNINRQNLILQQNNKMLSCSWSSKNNLVNLLKSRGLFDYKKSYEYEDAGTVSKQGLFSKEDWKNYFQK